MRDRRRDDRPPRDTLEGRAYRRVRRKMGFYTHAFVFVVVNLAMFATHLVTGRGHSHYMLAGWGLGLAIHGLVTFASLQGEGMRERMLREEIERMKRRERE